VQASSPELVSSVKWGNLMFTHEGTHAVAIVPTDFDNRRDVDLLIVNRDAPPLLFQNLRDGTFRDVAAEAGLAGAVGRDEDVTAVAAGRPRAT